MIFRMVQISLFSVRCGFEGKEIRKNAIVLGSTQGPALVPEEYQKPEKTPTEKAVEKSNPNIL
jgi:hypothetical protein